MNGRRLCGSVLSRLPLGIAVVGAARVEDDSVVRLRAIDPVLHQRGDVGLLLARVRGQRAQHGRVEVAARSSPSCGAVGGVPVGRLGPGGGDPLDIGEVSTARVVGLNRQDRTRHCGPSRYATQVELE